MRVKLLLRQVTLRHFVTQDRVDFIPEAERFGPFRREYFDPKPRDYYLLPAA
jgi:hypothetical protein